MRGSNGFGGGTVNCRAAAAGLRVRVQIAIIMLLSLEVFQVNTLGVDGMIRPHMRSGRCSLLLPHVQLVIFGVPAWQSPILPLSLAAT